MTRIVELLAVHGQLDVLVRAARAAAFAGDEPACRDAIGALRALLHGHMADEERWLFPAFAAFVAEGRQIPVDGTPAALAHDHALLRRHLGRLVDGPPEPVGRQDALSDLQAVLEHHDHREAGSLKPLLDRWLPPDERTAILGAWTLDPAPVPAPTGPWTPTAEPWPALAAVRRALAVGEPAELGVLAEGWREPFARKAALILAKAEGSSGAERWDHLRRLGALWGARVRRA